MCIRDSYTIWKVIEIDRHSNTTLLFFHFLSISLFFYFWLSETYSLISIQLFYDFDILQTFSKYQPDRGSNPPNEGTSDQKPSALSVEPHSHSRITKFENTYRTTNKTGVLSYYNSASPNPTGAPRRAFGPMFLRVNSTLIIIIIRPQSRWWILPSGATNRGRAWRSQDR